MGRKKKSDSLGRALIRDRFSRNQKKVADSMLHTSELDDGYDWGRLNLKSVTEESSFDDFLRTAELAGTEFQAEKLNIRLVDTVTGPKILTAADRKEFERLKIEKRDIVRIPRRPVWDCETSVEGLKIAENEAFLSWRRELALLQEVENLTLTPYEKNLDFWRQLWRVVERSDVIVQIVDARNPLLFRCEDLEIYTKETGPDKVNLLLLNKADFLTDSQRKAWCEYFDSARVRCAFFSAVQCPNAESIPEESEEKNEIPSDSHSNSDGEEDKNSVLNEEADLRESKPNGTDTADIDGVSNGVAYDSPECENEAGNGADQAKESSDGRPVEESAEGSDENGVQSVKSTASWKKNDYHILSPAELLLLFVSLGSAEALRRRSLVPSTSDRVIVGLVGYPNVGKSCTINALIGSKKVSVSATPGKTKHFQTLPVPHSPIMLCDCPGLVMPSLISTKADMILYGILPVDQMREWITPIAALRSMIPKRHIETLYGIMIPESENESAHQASHLLLNAYAYCRGLMTANGQPDGSRAARSILKDFVNGRLLYCTAPPGIDQGDYHRWIISKKGQAANKPPAQLTAIATRAIQDTKMANLEALNTSFFKERNLGSHTRGMATEAGRLRNGVDCDQNPGTSKSEVETSGNAKPWKDHSHKRNKREKLRRVYRHHDI